MSERMPDYAQGFKDGFAAGLEEGKKLAPKDTRLGDLLFGEKDTCPKCGITIGGAMGYVCQSINCPTYYKTWTGPTQYNEWSAVPGTVWAAGSHGALGAVGSTALDTDVPGTNGPSGPRGPIDYSMR